MDSNRERRTKVEVEREGFLEMPLTYFNWMAKNKTTETLKSVDEFINGIKDEGKRKDSFQIIKLFQKQTGFKPKMWGPSIIGFGSCHYKYESGREGDMPQIGRAHV